MPNVQEREGKPVVDQLAAGVHIPPLRDGERLEEWEPLFTAAVSPLLLKGEAGHVLAIGMLPAYVNRRHAERELVREVVAEEKNVASAFKVLIQSLDPPLDKYKAMQDLCRLDWAPGVQIDDYFYQLKRLGRHAGVDQHMICTLLVAQLPKQVQGKAKAWIAEHSGSLDDKAVRGFVSEVKQWLMDRGLTLDWGARSFTDSSSLLPERVAALSVDADAAGGAILPQGAKAAYQDERTVEHDVLAVRSLKGRGGGTRPAFKCYVCGKPGHVMRVCPERCCPRCGGKGHELRNCKRVLRVECHGTGEEAVTLNVRVDGQPVAAMLDSGAGISVIDRRSAEALGVLPKLSPTQGLGDKVYGVGGHVEVVGTVSVDVSVGQDKIRKHQMKVLNCEGSVVILGRDFLSTFPSVEFDWQGGRIRLGSSWMEPDLMVGGGQHSDRIALAMSEEPSGAAEDSKEFDINPALPESQRREIEEVIRRHRGAFAQNPKRPEVTHVIEHVIETGEARPVKQRTSRMSPSTQAEVDKQIDDMLRNGICRESSSPWSSRVILVRKKDQSYRFVVDYRGLNDVTKKDAYPAADCREILDKMDGSRFFSFLDGASAYWSVPVREEDKEKTAFSVARGHYEMNVMAYGLCNSQSTYQRAVDTVLAGVPQAETYVDDTCVHTATFSEHVQALDEALAAFETANLQLRRDKCKFGYTEGEFVGHEISATGCQPLQAHVDTITQHPTPAGKKELQRFLGLCNYYRHFVSGMSTMAEPLYQLLKKDATWSWSPSCQASFESLKNAMAKRTKLMFPRWDAPFYVEVDASKSGIGGVLSQPADSGNQRKPIAFFSSGLDATKKNYSAGELECWALIAATRKWRKYLRAASKIYLVTDHNPLVWLRRQEDPRHKFARWIMELEDLRYETVFKKGSLNAAADCLSRTPGMTVDEAVNDDEEHFERHVYRVSGDENLLQRLRDEQRRDPAVSLALSQMNKDGQVDQGRFKKYRGLHTDEGLLMKQGKVVVPRALQREIAEREHKMGHLGIERSCGSIADNFFWPGMLETVRGVCRECVVCGANKRSYQPKVQLQSYKLEDLAPRKVIAMDVATLPWSAEGYRHFLVVVDMCSRYAEFIPMKDQQADTICSALHTDWILHHGVPEILVSDQGRNVDGEAVRRLCAEHHIVKRRSSPYHPEGDGLAERCVQAAKQLLRCLLVERQMRQTDWPAVMKEVGFLFNSTVNASTKMTPQEVMYGVKLRSPFSSVLTSTPSDYALPQDVVAETRAATEAATTEVLHRSAVAHENAKRWYDPGKVPPEERKFKSGDLAFLKNEEPSSGLEPRFHGPFEVLSVKGVNVKLRIGRQDRWVHLNRVKRYMASPATSYAVPGAVPLHLPCDLDGAVSPVATHCEDVSAEACSTERICDRPMDEPSLQGEEAAVTHVAPEAESGPVSFLPTQSRYGRRIIRNSKFQ